MGSGGRPDDLRHTKRINGDGYPFPHFSVTDLASVWQPADLLFTSPAGAPLRGNNFGVDASRAAANVGIAGLVPHELRHTAASLAIASGASVKAVQSMFGHAWAAMTLDRYGHLYEDELDAIADHMDKAATSHANSCGLRAGSRPLHAVKLGSELRLY